MAFAIALRSHSFGGSLSRERAFFAGGWGGESSGGGSTANPSVESNRAGVIGSLQGEGQIRPPRCYHGSPELPPRPAGPFGPRRRGRFGHDRWFKWNGEQKTHDHLFLSR